MAQPDAHAQEPAGWQFRYPPDGPWTFFASVIPTQAVLDYWRKPIDEGGMGAEVRPVYADDKAQKICNWLRRQASAENDPAKREAFIEAHNAAQALK